MFIVQSIWVLEVLLEWRNHLSVRTENEARKTEEVVVRRKEA